MSTVSIRAFRNIGRTPEDAAQVPAEPGVDFPVVTFTGTAGASAKVGSENIIGMIASAAFRYAVGTDPTASSASWGPIPANTMFFVQVQRGHKISFIEA